MDDFTTIGDYFDEDLTNLKKFPKRCSEANIELSNEKRFMILTQGIVLGHHVFDVGIKVDLAKIEVISKMAPTTNKKSV